MISNLYIPGNLNLDRVLKTNPPAFKFKIDKFHYILHLLTEIPSINREFRDQKYIPFYSPLLQGVIHDYRQYLDYLLKNRILETDNTFIKGEKSKGYRFAEQYRTPVKEISVTDFTLQKRIRQEWKSNTCSTQYPRLRKYFNSGLQIDDGLACAFLKAEYEKETLAGNLNAFQAYNIGLLSVNCFREQNFHFTVDPTGHRLHTNLTNLKSELRNVVTYKGDLSVSIDIRNSQPLLSTILLSPDFYTSNTPIPFSFNYINSKQSIPININTTTITSSIMLAENQINLDIANVSDISIFKSKVTEGMLYEYIAEQFKAANPPIQLDRPGIKTMLFTVFFSDNRFFGTHSAYPKRLFQSIFPTVYSVYSHVKRTAHNNLAILLQNIESSLVLDFAVERIIQERSDLPIFTIHDSIVTSVGNEDYISLVLCEEMQKCIGVKPSLKIEYWNPCNLFIPELVYNVTFF